MAKVTSKLQLTLPKALAQRYGVKPGDEVEWTAAGDTIRLVLAHQQHSELDIAMRLKMFDQATDRQQHRKRSSRGRKTPKERGWTREELYKRGRTD